MQGQTPAPFGHQPWRDETGAHLGWRLSPHLDRAPPPERHLTGVPFLDTLFHGVFMLAPPVHASTIGEASTDPLSWLAPVLRPVELLLLLLWMVKKEVISLLAFPFLMWLMPFFHDGAGRLSFMSGIRGALPEFRRGMGAGSIEDPLVARHPWTTKDSRPAHGWFRA